MTLRYYPYTFFGSVPDPAELWYRLPVFYLYGDDSAPLEAALAVMWQNWREFAAFPGGWATPFVVFDAMGI